MLIVLLLLVLSTPLYAQLLPEDEARLEKREVVLADESDGADSGNWYEKLKWWKEAKWTYTVDVIGAIEHLATIESSYNLRQDDMLAKVNAYIEALPIKTGEAEKEIDDLVEDMVRRQNEIAKEEANKRDESQSDQLEQQKKMLTDLKEKFSHYNMLVKRIKKVFDEIVPRQLTDAKLYEKKALRAYKEIENILDDKKAELLFYEVENSLENIKAIANYLKNPLNAFLDKAWSKAQQVMPQITSTIQQLEVGGVIVRPLSSEEKEQMTAIEKQRLELKAQRADQAEAAKKLAALPWYQKLFSKVGSFFSSLWSWGTSLFILIGSFFTRPPDLATDAQKKVIAQTPQQESAPAEPTLTDDEK